MPGQLVLLLVLSALPAQRSVEPVMTDSLISTADDAYAELSYEAALATLDQALAQPGNSREQLVRIFRLQGLCAASLGQEAQARLAFTRLLSLSPEFRLSADLSPRLHAPFEAVLSHRPAPLRAEVTLRSPAARDADLPIQIMVHSDPAELIRSVTLTLRGSGATPLRQRIDVRGQGLHVAEVAPALWQPLCPQNGEPLTWYAVVEGPSRAVLDQVGDASQPLRLALPPGPTAPPLRTRWWLWAAGGGALAAVAAASVTAAVIVHAQRTDSTADFVITTSVQD